MGTNRKRRRESDRDEISVDLATGASPFTEPNINDVEPSKKRVQQRRTLFIRALPATTTTDSLIEHFSETFPIKHATAVIDPETAQCKGYGFITFADSEDAQKAVLDFQGSLFQGRRIKIEIAEPRNRDVEESISGERSRSKPTAAAVEAKAKREQEQQSQRQPPPRLIIRNLPWSVKNADQLAKLFLSYGKVKNAVVPQIKPGLQSGFGFVTIRGQKNAENALKGVNGSEIDGRVLAVDWAVNRDTWQSQNPEPVEQPSEASKDGLKKGLDHLKHKSLKDALSGADHDVVEDVAQEDPDEIHHIAHEEEEGEEEDEEEEEEEEDDEEEVTSEEDTEQMGRLGNDYSSTLFIRNLPFSSTDETLREHFEQFGAIRYARIVVDRNTERPRGTGFVCFFKTKDAESCLKSAPRIVNGLPGAASGKGSVSQTASHSILQNEEADPTGEYTLDGRVLQVSRAVVRSEATRLSEATAARRSNRDKDKRRLYLLSEGTISPGSTLYSLLSHSETAMREQSAKQRKTMIQNNPSLNLSLTRLSIRNIPRSVTSKDLKQLAREAVVGFATDVKAGKRERISKEELARGGEEMADAEKERKVKGKGVIKQAKVVFEGREGAKVQEESGAGRSRGYGFVEYHTHRAALMGLRWLNGHAVGYKAAETQKGKSGASITHDKNKRLIVEFAIENAQVVHRRQEREKTYRGSEKPQDVKLDGYHSSKKVGRRFKNAITSTPEQNSSSLPDSKIPAAQEDKLATRSRIIAKKRAQRRERRKCA